MFVYKTLENTDIERIHEAFINAFSDYQVKIEMPLIKLKQMLQRRGYVPQISMGAFKDGELVGFVLNGLRDWDSKATVYDTGTGVIKEYRKQGITSSMLSNIRKVFKEKGVQQYLLEVIQSNTAAVELYKKQGFETIRDFKCFQLSKSMYEPISTCKVEHSPMINSSSWNKLKELWDFTPSWQNSIDSINAAWDTFNYSFAYDNDTIIGYGIVDKKTGDIPQIAVDKKFRHKGIGRSILTDLLDNTESNKISVLNVDSRSESMGEFLLKSGFLHSVDQYEMILNL
jgi:Acetyltransferases